MPYTTISRATLRARLQDHYTADPFWTVIDANDALNEALRYFNLFTGYWRGTGTMTTPVPSGTPSPFLTIPGTLTYRTRIVRLNYALTRKSIVELYRTRRDWRRQTTASGGSVPTTVREWAPVGLSQIAIWPADAAGDTVLAVSGVRQTPILSTDAGFLDLGEEEITLILAETLYILSFKRPSILGTLKAQHQRFLQGVLARNDQIRASSYYRRLLGLDQTQRLEPSQVAATADEET